MLRAQTCNGSVGDPIVNIPFDTAAALPAGTTNLTYQSNDCPVDGYYTIAQKTSICFSDTWHTLTDHTKDSAANFMLINASFAPSDFYLQTINGLCTGTTFQFGAWIANMCNFANSIKPNVTFTIEKTDGTVLSTYNTGDIPVDFNSADTGVWKQYGFNFTMPVGVSTVVLRMKNNAPGGIGNDLALDDITFRPIGPAISISSPDFTADSLLVCTKDTRNLTFHSTVENCYAATGYQWQVSTNRGATWADIAGANSPDFVRTPTSAGVYQYRLTVAEQNNISSAICRVTSKKFTVVAYGVNVRTISISTPSSGAVCEDVPITFTASTTYAGSNPSFQWMVNNAIVANEASDSIFTTTSLNNGDKVACYFVSSLSCNDPLTSNAIAADIIQKARLTIDHVICEGETYEGYTTSGVYKDSFPGSNGCDSVRTLNLTVYPKEHTTFDTTICYGTNYSGLNASGSYNFTYQSVHGCDSVHTIQLHVLPDNNAKPYLDTILCSGDSIMYSPGMFDSYLWQDGSTSSNYTITMGGNYRVTFTNKCGTATRNITVDERVCIVAFPTAFSPNGDGRNDIFKVLNGYNLSQYHCLILNRWGQKVFESSDPEKGWDGTINGRQADVGVYLWFCNYTSKSKRDRNSLRGTVVLLR